MRILFASFDWPEKGGGSGGSGDVSGPTGATNNAVARFDGTTGKIIKNSVVIIDNSGAVTGITSLAASGAISGATLSSTGLTTANSLQVTTTTTLDALTASRVVQTNASKQLESSSITNTELGYLSGVTSAIQTQLNARVVGPASATDNALARFDLTTGKLVKNSVAILTDAGALTGITQYTSTASGLGDTMNLDHSGSGDTLQIDHSGSGEGININSGSLKLNPQTASRVLELDANKRVVSSAVTSTELGYLSGVTSSIQTQLDAKQARSTLTTKGDIYVATASATTDRLAVGANGYVLKANSGTTTGLEYGVGNNSSNAIINGTITASVATNDLTIELKTLAGTDPSSTDPVFVYFKNNSNTVATYDLVTITSALSITVPSGATLGQRDGNYSYIYVFLINNAGTAELAVSRSIRDDSYPRNTILLDTSSDSSADIYSAAARTNVSLRLLGVVGNTQTTAGTWASAPSYVTGQGFLRSMPEMVAYISSQAVTSGNDIVYTTLVRDRLNGYDVATGIYTIRERGAYVAIASAATGGIASGAASNFFLILLIKTGAPALTIAGNRDAADASVTRTFSSIATMYFLGNAGDTIKVQMQENIGAGSLDGNEQRNYFMVYKVSDLGF